MNDQEDKVQNVEALQLHYTSCQHGVSGYAGFQVRAISEGITPEEKRALERLGMYEPPRNMPSESSPEEIQNSFPKAFRSIFLETGKLAVVRSVYAGQDYTGRWGNYFAHALVFNKSVSDLWPVDLYEWNGWKDNLPAKEDNPEVSTVLPLTVVQPDSGAYAFAELQEFLLEDSSRTGYLADMIRAVLLHKSTSRKLVIKEELESVGLFWIACLQKAFAPAHQRTLGCSSYQFDSRSCQLVNVTLHETDFILGETERLYQFYVFDFLENTFSEITRQQDDYAETVAGWMSGTPELLQEFHEFSRKFDCSVLDETLLSMLRLFQLYKGDKDSLPQNELISTLEFVRLHSKPDAFEETAHIITSSAQSLVRAEDPLCMKELLLFFISCFDIRKKEQYIDSICSVLLRMFDHALLQNNFAVYEQTVELRTQIKQKIPTFDKDFSEAFLADEHLVIINGNISSRSEEILAVSMKELVAAVQTAELSENEYENEYENAKVKAFIENIVSATAPQLNRLAWLFEPSVHDPGKTAQLFSVISRLDLDNDARKNLSELFAETLSDKEQEYRITVIEHLKPEQSAWPLLYEDWRRCIAKKKRKKISTHTEYCQHILFDNSVYAQQAYGVLSQELWEMLSKKEQCKQAERWIHEEQIEKFSATLVQDVFLRASEKISFNPKDSGSEDLSQKLLLQFKKVVPSPPHTPYRLKLREAVRNVYAENTSVFDTAILSELHDILRQVDEKTYKEFIELYLLKVLYAAENAAQHGTILRYLFIHLHIDVFQNIYLLFIKKGSRKDIGSATNAALKFWLLFNPEHEEYVLLSSLHRDAFHGLVLRLAKLHKDAYFELIEQMEKNRNLTHEARQAWNELRDAAEAKRNRTILGMLGKIRNVFQNV